MKPLDGTIGWNHWMKPLDGTIGWNPWMEPLDGILSTPLFKNLFTKRNGENHYKDIYRDPQKNFFKRTFGAQLRRRCMGVRSDRRVLGSGRGRLAPYKGAPIPSIFTGFHYTKISQHLLLKTPFGKINRENHCTKISQHLLLKTLLPKRNRENHCKDIYRDPQKKIF
jgi:hypothetical protein